ncbi:MAG: DUF3879 family protein [Sporomusaceae bacterium]|nr:DUF3879 family protein [Sporomusaceae bacterium]
MMYAGDGDTSWKKIVPVPEDLKNDLINLVRQQFANNANGMSGEGDSKERIALMREYRSSLPENERASASWTLNDIIINEQRRMVAYVKGKDPSWEHGKPINKDILAEAVSGKSLDITV